MGQEEMGLPSEEERAMLEDVDNVGDDSESQGLQLTEINVRNHDE